MAVLFDEVKITKATSKKEKYKSECMNPASAFAKDTNINDLRKLEGGLKAVATCKYLQSPFHMQ